MNECLVTKINPVTRNLQAEFVYFPTPQAVDKYLTRDDVLFVEEVKSMRGDDEQLV